MAAAFQPDVSGRYKLKDALAFEKPGGGNAFNTAYGHEQNFGGNQGNAI